MTFQEDSIYYSKSNKLSKFHSDLLMQKATRQQLKEQNQDLVLKIFFESSPISRADIARKTGLTRTTVSDITADLIAQGLVSEVGMGVSLGGRSPILLSLVSDSRYMIGLDLANEQFCGAVVDLRGEIHEIISLPVGGYTGEQAIQATLEIVDRLVALPYSPLLGISVGAPGLINSKEGVVNYSANMDWRNLPLKRILHERYGLPVIVLNDCQAAAMGEYKYGSSAPAIRNMVVIRVAQGIGAGVIVDGKVFPGDGGSAGEIGHITMLDADDPVRCRCGKIGCLETVASSRAVLRKATGLAVADGHRAYGNGENPLTFEDMIQAYQNDDSQIREIVDRAAYYLGVSIAGLVSTLNIHRIILMGDMTRFGGPWLDVVRKTMRRFALPQPGQDTQIQIGLLRDNDVILGASALLAEDTALLLRTK